jgi:hypothetical protein
MSWPVATSQGTVTAEGSADDPGDGMVVCAAAWTSSVTCGAGEDPPRLEQVEHNGHHHAGHGQTGRHEDAFVHTTSTTGPAVVFRSGAPSEF